MELVVGGIAINLEDAGEAGKYALNVRATASRCICVGDRWWGVASLNPLPRTVIAGNRPQIIFLGSATAWIERRTGRCIGEEFR